AIGWLLAENVHAQDLEGVERIIYDAVVRFYMFGLAVTFWAVGVVFIQGRALHCGGTRELAPDDLGTRYLVFWQFPLLILQVISLLYGGPFLLVYGALFFFSMCLFIGKIGYDNAFRVLAYVIRWG